MPGGPRRFRPVLIFPRRRTVAWHRRNGINPLIPHASSELIVPPPKKSKTCGHAFPEGSCHGEVRCPVLAKAEFVLEPAKFASDRSLPGRFGVKKFGVEPPVSCVAFVRLNGMLASSIDCKAIAGRLVPVNCEWIPKKGIRAYLPRSAPEPNCGNDTVQVP